MFNVTLAKDYKKFSHKINYPAAVLPKLDGVRAVFRMPNDDDEGGNDGQYHFYSRTNKRWNDNVVAHLLEPLRESFSLTAPVVLDGEFYKHGWTCQRINGAVAVRRKEPGDDTTEIEFAVFDLFFPSTPDAPFVQRYAGLSALIYPKGVYEVPAHQVGNEDETKELYAAYMEKGFEGVMIRNLNAPYEHKRTHNLLKFKEFKDTELTCVDMYEGKDTDKGGRLLGTMGGITLYVPDIHDHSGDSIDYCKDCTTDCGSGFNDEQRAHYWNNRDDIIGKDVTVKFFEYTPAHMPRFPIFQGVRDYE